MKITNNLPLLICFLFSTFANIAFSQPEILEQHSLMMTGRAFDNSIKLRWAPTSMYAWQESNKVGYVLERFTFKKDGKILPLAERKDSKILTKPALKPWTKGEDWKPLMERNAYAAIAAQALYGKSFTASTANGGLVAQKDEQFNRFAFGLFAADQSLEVAAALGLYFEDKTVVAGEHYLYRIYPASLPSEMPIDTGFLYLGTDEKYTLPKVMEVQSEFTDKYAFISWDKKMTEEFYNSFEVSRSTDGKNFTVVNAKPFVGLDKEKNPTDRMLLRDSLEKTDQVYMYRVQGRTIFEELGPPSDMVQGMGKNAKVVSPNIETIANADNTSLNITWDFLTAAESEIRGFQIQRCPTDRGVYQVISGENYLEKSSRYFEDKNPLAVNYYKIVAIDKYGRTISSFAALAQLDDETPPAPPVDLRGTVMEDGTMVVSWSPNEEADLMGYRVYLANRKDRKEYVQLTAAPVRTNYYSYIVPMNTLSEKIFVKIKAIDFRQNKSAFSEVVTILRPDSIPPAAPVFRSARPTTKAVTIIWENSASADVVNMLLQRKEQAATPWETLQDLQYPTDLNIKSYQDTTTARGKLYEYRLQATDDADLVTYSRIITASKIDNGIRRPVETVNAEVDRKAKAIALKWNYQPDGNNLTHFVIYRIAKDGRPRKYDVLQKTKANEGAQNWEYIDKSLQMDTNYHYQIRAMYADGGQSPLSAKISVNY